MLERVTNNITRYSEKQDLPVNPYEKKRPALIEYLSTLNEDTTSYDLDDYGVVNLDMIPFSQKTEEISMFNNKLDNPG